MQIYCCYQVSLKFDISKSIIAANKPFNFSAFYKRIFLYFSPLFSSFTSYTTFSLSLFLPLSGFVTGKHNTHLTTIIKIIIISGTFCLAETVTKRILSEDDKKIYSHTHTYIHKSSAQRERKISYSLFSFQRMPMLMPDNKI